VGAANENGQGMLKRLQIVQPRLELYFGERKDFSPAGKQSASEQLSKWQPAMEMRRPIACAYGHTCHMQTAEPHSTANEARTRLRIS
jgi:hypothetical protein